MPGPIRVGMPTRIRHIPLSWPVEKARSNHQPKFRPVNDTVLRGREVTVGEVMEQMFAAMPSPNDWIDGTSDAAAYLQEATEVAEPFRVRIAEMLQVTFNEGALLGQDSIRADINVQLERLGSPLRLTGEDGRVTKRVAARVEEVAVEHVGRHPTSKWAPIGVEAFDVVDAKSVQYAQFRSGTLVTNMVEEQQRVIRGLIGESFTVQQTFQAVGDFPARTVTGLTAQQTAHALVEVLQEVNPTSQIGQNLAKFRGVNANGLTRPWEKAVYRRAETLADRLASQGVTGVKAQMRIQKDAQRYADKLRRSRARMISRTEIKNAQVQGRLESFRQTVNDGLADPATAGKQWVTGATDVCSICSELGMSKPISLDNSFEGGFDGPTAHPNCRCDVMFVHDIATPPKAVPAGDPAYRPGTPENPITWEFPSGFRTQPSATTAFTPPGFAPPPPAPPPPPKPPPPQPAEPPPPVEVAPTPAQTGPVSNADLVWDDAGRKWADLTDAERQFLFDSHVDEVVRNAFDDVVAGYPGKPPSVTRPSLPKPPPTAIKAIYRQAELVDDLKAQEAAARVVRDDMGLVYGPDSAMPGQFNPTGWRDAFYAWADDTTEGFVAGEGNAGFVRVKETGMRGTSIPGSNRRLTVSAFGEGPLVDANAVIDVHDLTRAMERLFPSIDSLPSSGIAELEREMTKLGTMIRREATARVGGVEAAPNSWVTRQFPNSTAQVDDVAELSTQINKLDIRYNTLKGQLDEALDAADAGRLPARRAWHLIDESERLPTFASRADELEYLAVWEPLETALADAVDDALRSLIQHLPEREALNISSAIRNIRERVGARLRVVHDPMEEVVKLLDEAVTELRQIFPNALELFNPGGANPLHFQYQVQRRLVDIMERVDYMATAQRHIGSLIGEGFDDIAAAVAEKVRILHTVKGSVRGLDQSAASSLVSARVEAALTEKVYDVARLLHANDLAGVDQLLLGQLSSVTSGVAQDIRLAIGEVLREVRLIGGEVFDYQPGVSVHGFQGFKTITPRVRKALDSMNEAVEDWMPTDWIVRSNERGSLGFNGETSRAHYRDSMILGRAGTAEGNGLINIGRSGSVPDQSTMLHEVFHRGQRATTLFDDLERQFAMRRIAASPAENQVLRKLNEIYPDSGYRDWEWAYEDEFLSAYIGKDYGTGRFLEVSPMAIQELTGSHLAGGSGKSLVEGLGGDLDFIDWIVGMLAGL